MEAGTSRPTGILSNPTVRRWISRAFIVSILVYLIVLGYLLVEAITGASKWAPYGVNIPIFIALVIASEIAMLLTAIHIFREDSGIWPPEITEGWETFRGGAWLKGAGQMLSAGWDISLIDLRLRTSSAIFSGRLNRVASIVPLAYALLASAGGAPWGLRGSAIFDIVLSVVVWAFMEAVMVQPERRTQAAAVPAPSANGTATAKSSVYSVRAVQPADIDRLVELEVRNWRDQAAGREIIEKRLRHYPKGQIAAVHTTVANGSPSKSKIAAWCTLMPVSAEHVASYATWDELTSNGTLRARDLKGSVLIGVNLTSVTEGGTYILSAEALASVVEDGRDKLITGSRLTGFVSFNEHRAAEGKPPLSADAYARLREIRGFRINEGRLDAGLDPLPDDEYRTLASSMRAERGESPLSEDDVPDYVSSNVRAYMSVPGTRLLRVVPGYFRDPSSADYGVLMEWPNPVPRLLRNIPPIRSFVAKKIRTAIHAEWDLRKKQLRERAARRARERVPTYLRKDEEDGVVVEAVEQAAQADKPVRRP